jgi:Ser/Thr protein kinase RdoA (MazF antagonist)
VDTSPGDRLRLSVQRSIVSATALAPLVAQAYGLDHVRCQLVKSAMLDTYAISTATGPAMLRIYPARRRTQAAILAELELLTVLHAAGLAVSVPIPQRSGDRLLRIEAPEGVRHAALFTVAPGQPVSQHPTAPNVRACGHLLAQIHQRWDHLAHRPRRPPLDLETLLDRSLAALERVFGQHSDAWQDLRQRATALRPRILALPTEPPVYGLCHGDFGSANAHVTDDGQITLFDFDLCGPGWRVYDIGTFVLDEPAPLVQAFLAGYESVRPLSAAEQAAIPLFQIVQSIWVLGLRADYVNDWGRSALSERLLGHVLAFIKHTSEQHLV